MFPIKINQKQDFKEIKKNNKKKQSQKSGHFFKKRSNNDTDDNNIIIKQLNGRFKRLISNISRKKIWTCLRKGNLKRETESLQIAALNNAIKTNHIKARKDKVQQNSKCRLFSERDETINHIISVFRN